MNSVPHKVFLFLGAILASVILSCAGCVLYLEQYTMPPSKMRRIDYGMSKGEIREALGDPYRIDSDGNWIYRAINFSEGQVLIEFDENGLVDYVGIE